MSVTIKNITLPTGKLSLTLSPSDFELDDLTAYAARQNPKRGFLFVSKLLAKYWPSEPEKMQAMYAYLAQCLQSEIEGVSVFIGMAEAAAGLGQGVYEAYLDNAANDSHLFIHTSRYFLEGIEAVDFQEQHSHASQFYLYVPQDKVLKANFLDAETLVLIDDEVTTGTTFANLITAYQKINPQLKKVLIVSILNFVDVQRQQEIRDLIGIELIFISALAAQIEFKRNESYQYKNIPKVDSLIRCKQSILSLQAGRLGIQGCLQWDKAVLNTLMQNWSQADTILILGTGEFMHLAFLMAAYIEQQGWAVRMQSTARSPLFKGEAITEKMEFVDNYADNIPNYLYNVRVGQYDHVLICHETPLCASLQQTAQRLNATLLYYVDGKISVS